MPSCPRTLSTLIALMVAVQCCMFLLSKVLRRTALSARKALLSRGYFQSSPLQYGRKLLRIRGPALWFPSVANGVLVFDEPKDRSGLEALNGGYNNHLDALLGREVADEMRRRNGVPETLISSQTGVIGYIDNTGTLRTEPGIIDPLAGYVRKPLPGEPGYELSQSDSVRRPDQGTDQMAKVIDLRKRQAGER